MGYDNIGFLSICASQLLSPYFVYHIPIPSYNRVTQPFGFFKNYHILSSLEDNSKGVGYKRLETHLPVFNAVSFFMMVYIKLGFLSPHQKGVGTGG